MFFKICIFCAKRLYFYFFLLSHYITLNLALFYQSECSAARGTRMKVEATEDWAPYCPLAGFFTVAPSLNPQPAQLPWYPNFVITTIGSPINDDGDGNENDKKAIALARASRLFVHFLAVAAWPRHETSQFHSPALWSRWSKYEPFGFNPRKFRQHLTK